MAKSRRPNRPIKSKQDSRPSRSDRPKGGGRDRGKPTGSREKSSSPKVSLPRGRYVVGVHSAKEVINVRPHAVDSVWLKKGWEENKELVFFHDWAKENKVPVNVQSGAFFSNICQTHQGLCLVVTERPAFDYKSLDADEVSRVLILDQLEDPHNLGAIMRTAWLLGVKAIFVPKKQGSPLTPTAIKVASGAAEHIPVLEESNLASVIEDLKKQSFWIYGLAQNHDADLYNVELPKKVCWVVGSEANGIRKPVLRACDQIISIPQVIESASYNASVACAMALSETVRQQQKLN